LLVLTITSAIRFSSEANPLARRQVEQTSSHWSESSSCTDLISGHASSYRIRSSCFARQWRRCRPNRRLGKRADTPGKCAVPVKIVSLTSLCASCVVRALVTPQHPGRLAPPGTRRDEIGLRRPSVFGFGECRVDHLAVAIAPLLRWT
jgi:hypothetical protein